MIAKLRWPWFALAIAAVAGSGACTTLLGVTDTPVPDDGGGDATGPASSGSSGTGSGSGGTTSGASSGSTSSGSSSGKGSGTGTTSSGTSTTTSSGTSSGRSSGSTSGSSSSGSSSSGTTSACPTPLSNSSKLPFAVDASFVRSGYLGDYTTVREETDTTCGGNRSSASALGLCHTFTYYPLPEAGAGKGWAGVAWQYPVDNWGSSPGYLIPPGATKVSFWVRGQTGKEMASFSVGRDLSYQTVSFETGACVDAVSGWVGTMTLPAVWTHVTIPLQGTYAGGVVSAFTWVAGGINQPAGASQVTFYIDDIEWQT